eukprot:TRINITY_DN534_c0_g1_i2.p1 TRINITY_DN534_c0_g1~~TRINITY_DN534_c0_g1_i2.p1  ORF type:complete len:1465 (-),score=368.91 TRINITY_DN534_c0_g1_i2:53-4408(-)
MPAAKGPGEALQPGENIKLNQNDCESGLSLLGGTGSGTRERARRKAESGTQWAGVRADCGVASEGLWAFCVWNESGGNLRIGWSTDAAKLALGTDRYSWGFGGTATKSHNGNFEKFGQTFGKDDAVTCCLDLERRAILYFKNGREIPGDCFTFGKEYSGCTFFPHVYTKEATFSVSFDGSGGAPGLSGGFKWIGSGECALIPHHTRKAGGGPVKVAEDAGADGGPQFVLTPYGWRTVEQAGGITQEWRTNRDAYVKHFTASLELEYEAERQAVLEKVQKRSIRQLQEEGVGVGGLSAEFDGVSGRVTLWSDRGRIPWLSEIKFGRAVLLSTEKGGGIDLEDPKKTISCEVENMGKEQIVLSTPYERLPGSAGDTFRIDLGPNIVANKRIDTMLDELQRCLGVDQAANPRDAIQKLNYNANLCGILLPGAPLADALYADIQESSAAAAKWDPLSRMPPNPKADVSRHAREKDIGAEPYSAKSSIHSKKEMNESQQSAVNQVLNDRRRFNLVQGPPGTGKTTTASAIIAGWLQSNRGPVLASAFSNRGCDNIAQQLHGLGVKVLRMGLCSAKEPYSLETRLSELGYRRGDKGGLQAVFKSVDVVCATCIGCGMGPMDSRTFPFIVIDEAAQVIEPAVILPLGKGAVQAVMVGDQCQLPATVLSQEAQSKGLDISMFDRLLSMGMEYTLLTDQYRMHPSISAFPSWRFYRGELKNAVTDRDRQLPDGLPFHSNLVFLHVDALESSGGASKKNEDEAYAASWVVDLVMEHGIRPEEIGVITPYGAQVTTIRNSLPYNAQLATQVSSVDAFQGSEREVIIFSLVRANKRGDIGFVADWRRLNVALTRAKRLCVVIGNIPTWMNASSTLLRDWLGFHQVGRADVRAFRGGALTTLPGDVLSRVQDLRTDFHKNNPEPGKLTRTEKAARNVSASGKKMREITQALEDAIQEADETVLKSVISQAKEAGIEKSIIDEAETHLEGFAAAKKLRLAMKSKDPTALVQAIIQAKITGMDEDKIKEAEDLMGELMGTVSQEDAGRSFYAPAPKEEATAPVVEQAAPKKKAASKKSWAGLLNTGPKYAGRARESQEELPPEPERPSAVAREEPAAEAPQAASEKGKGKGKGKSKGKEKPAGPCLRVDPDLGAGLELTPTCWGMHVDLVEDKPGQPDLTAGCTITVINGASLLGLENEDAVADTFGEHFKDGVSIEVDPVSFETIELPAEASTWPLSFTEDLGMMADKFAVDWKISKLGLEFAGPSVAIEPVKVELKELLNFYLKGQSAEQKQREVDKKAMQMAIQKNEERQRREAEEWTAWQNYLQQMQQTYTAYALAAQQQAMQEQMAYQQAMYQQQQQMQMASLQQQPQMFQPQMFPQQPMMYQPQMGAQMQTPWVSYQNPQGGVYYVNEQTGEMAWQLPPGVLCRTGGMQGGCCGGGYGQQMGWGGQQQWGGYGGQQQSWY